MGLWVLAAVGLVASNASPAEGGPLKDRCDAARVALHYVKDEWVGKRPWKISVARHRSTPAVAIEMDGGPNNENYIASFTQLRNEASPFQGGPWTHETPARATVDAFFSAGVSNPMADCAGFPGFAVGLGAMRVDEGQSPDDERVLSDGFYAVPYVTLTLPAINPSGTEAMGEAEAFLGPELGEVRQLLLRKGPDGAWRMIEASDHPYGENTKLSRLKPEK